MNTLFGDMDKSDVLNEVAVKSCLGGLLTLFGVVMGDKGLYEPTGLDYDFDVSLAEPERIENEFFGKVGTLSEDSGFYGVNDGENITFSVVHTIEAKFDIGFAQMIVRHFNLMFDIRGGLLDARLKNEASNFRTYIEPLHGIVEGVRLIRNEGSALTQSQKEVVKEYQTETEIIGNYQLRAITELSKMALDTVNAS